MSLLDPTQLDEVLPSLTIEQRQAIVDRGESFVAGLIGRETVQVVTTGGTPETETASLSHDGGVTEDGSNVAITDPADPEFIGSPLGARSEILDFYVPSQGRLVEIPSGPITAIADITIDGVDIPLADLLFHSWSLRYRNNLSQFFCGQRIVVTATTGFTRRTAPAQFTEAIILAIDIIRSKSSAGGALKSLAKTSESLGPYRATFGEAGRASSAISAGDTLSAQDILRNMVAPWARPRGLV